MNLEEKDSAWKRDLQKQIAKSFAIRVGMQWSARSGVS